ncbi:MAG: Ig-like domain-containing protein [Actinomycetota bacterium]|nr:Ig-like domain-containing protein [Actinomycetota bacterium]
MAFITALMVVFALVVPFVGTALANHQGQTVQTLDVTPDTDSAPAQTCNAFTVTLQGTQPTGDNNPGVPGETVDVLVRDTDANNTATAGNEAQSDITFCTPPAGNDPTGAETGPNPVGPAPGQEGATANVNNASQRQGEFCCTNENGQLTFGILSNEEGNFAVTAFFDDEDDDNPAGDIAETVTKTFTAAPATGNEGVETVDCEPESDTNPEGTAHSFNCVARDVNGNPVSGATIQFDVTAGPNAEEQGVQNCQASTTNQQGETTINQPANNQTAANGQATCTYTDVETADNQTTADTSPPGTDTIVAFVSQTPPAGQTGTGGADAFEPQDQITKTFVGDANNIECEPDGATATSGNIVTITCTVTDEAGQPVPGINVTFTETGAGAFRTGQDTTCVTDQNGQCSIEVQTAETEEGTITVTGTIRGAATAAEGNTQGFGSNCTVQGQAETGTNAQCSDTATVTVTQEPDQGPQADCNDGVDNDADGLIDFGNDPGCTSASDQTEAPNPDDGTGERRRVATNLTIRYDRDARAFKGAIGSDRKACQTGRTIILKKVTPGPNRVIGRDASNRFGNWRINKARARGRFYAVVLRKQTTGRRGAELNCLRDRSVTIKLRRR